jgi:hypothetical protein
MKRTDSGIYWTTVDAERASEVRSIVGRPSEDSYLASGQVEVDGKVWAIDYEPVLPGEETFRPESPMTSQE